MLKYENKQKNNKKRLIQNKTTIKLLKIMATRKQEFCVAIAVTVISTIASASIPYLTGLALDSMLKDIISEKRDYNIILVFSIFLITTGLIAYIFNAFAIYFGERYTGLLTMKLRRDIFTSLQQQSYEYFSENSTGDLVSRTTDDIMALWEMFFTLPYFGTRALVYTTWIIGSLFFINAWLALICLIATPIIWVLIKNIQDKFQPKYFEARKKYSEINEILQENLDGAKVVRSFSAKNIEASKLEQVNLAYKEHMCELNRLRGIFWPQLRILIGIVSVFILVIGGIQVINGNLSTGMLISAILLTNMLVRPIDLFSDMVFWYSRGTTVGKRILDILDSKPVVLDSPNANDIPENIKGELSFENVSFKYHETYVIENLNLKISAGSTVAILGATGSGKSTLINLIPRFYDPTEGTVYIDDIDIKSFKRESLRSRVGFVDQETFLFSTSIHKNIAFGKPEATREEVIEAAKLAHAHDFIENLTNGYDTKIGERGVNLSGGQRQRIAIARALLINPLVVIFDDSLSAVDAQTERKIQKATEYLFKGRTTIIITQRMSTTSTADYIIVLDQGRIVEEGSHNQLLSINGIYSKLYETQKDGYIDYDLLATMAKEVASDA